jgi:hypothetical protein
MNRMRCQMIRVSSLSEVYPFCEIRNGHAEVLGLTVKTANLRGISPIYVLLKWGSRIQIGFRIAHCFGRLVRSWHWA